MIKKTVSLMVVLSGLISTFFSLVPLSSLAQSIDCTTIGQRVAAEQAGRLAKATPEMQNGKNVCVVVVLVPGKEGEKSRRVEVAVPAN